MYETASGNINNLYAVLVNCERLDLIRGYFMFPFRSFVYGRSNLT